MPVVFKDNFSTSKPSFLITQITGLHKQEFLMLKQSKYKSEKQEHIEAW